MIVASSYMSEIVHCLWLALWSMASIVLGDLVVSKFDFVFGVGLLETVKLIDAFIKFKRFTVLSMNVTMWGSYIWVF